MAEFNELNQPVFSQVLEDLCTVPAMFRLTRKNSNSIVGSCPVLNTGSESNINGSVCPWVNTVGSVVAGACRLIEFSLYVRSSGELLQNVSVEMSRLSETVPEGFVFDPMDLETE